MEYLIKIWPFVPGQQETIFQIAGLGIIGLIILNVTSSIRQKLPTSKIVSGLFAYIPNKNKVEIIIGKLLYAILMLGFFATLIDILINGNQLIQVGM